jgi:hypothetical protein
MEQVTKIDCGLAVVAGLLQASQMRVNSPEDGKSVHGNKIRLQIEMNICVKLV